MTTQKEKSLPLWEKTQDKIGLRPLFDLVCPICSTRNVRTPLVLRRSRIHQVADVRIYHKDKAYRPYAFDNAYKCPECGFYCVFGIATDIEYALKTLQLRGQHVDYILPEELWDDNEQIKERLERLGYWGANVQDKEKADGEIKKLVEYHKVKTGGDW